MMAWPLTELTKKGQAFKWGNEQQEAFKDLKEQFMIASILSYPDPSLPFWVKINASVYAIGVVLIVKEGDVWHPTAYMSKALSGAKLNWSVRDKELFVIIKAFITWRHWLLLAKHKIKVWCDHMNLLYFRKPQALMAKQL